MEVTTKIELGALRRPLQAVEESVVIGKDVLELFAGAMYAEPLSVYREYVQNAADSLDAARQAGITPREEADIVITFNHADRGVTIRDHGFGVPAEEFVRRLTAIGASQKRGTAARGFRGVGRLSGLGYCQELVFRSRTHRDGKVKEMRWDGRVLRERLRDGAFNGELKDLIREVAKVTDLPGAEFPAHFFEVEMRKLLRVKNDVLLNEDAVREYLGHVAPVPFSSEFKLGDSIQSWLEARGVSAPIRISLQDGRGLVARRHSNQLHLSSSLAETFREVDFIEYRNSDEELLAVGWVLDHSYAGAVPRRLGLGGIRLRHGNIQVGADDILSPLFAEPRFSQWVIGELHVLHPRIIPNARRDEFEHTAQYAELHERIRDLTKQLTDKIRQRSDQRVKLKKVMVALQHYDGWIAKAKEQTKTVLSAAATDRAEQFFDEAVRALSKLKPGTGGGERATKLVAKAERELEEWIRQNSRRFKAVDPIQHAALTAILASSFRPNSAVELATEVVNAMSRAKRAA